MQSAEWKTAGSIVRRIISVKHVRSTSSLWCGSVKKNLKILDSFEKEFVGKMDLALLVHLFSCIIVWKKKCGMHNFVVTQEEDRWQRENDIHKV